jgi:hypothetical protein
MPHEATEVGLRKYDGHLLIASPTNIKKLHASLDKLESELKSLKGSSAEGEFNIANLIARVKSLRSFLNISVKTPALYPLNLLFACHTIMVRDFIPNRIRRLTSRLEKVREYLKHARRNVVNASKRHLEVALKLTSMAVNFLKHGVPKWVEEVGGPKTTVHLARKSAKEFQRYADFLSDCLPSAPRETHFSKAGYEEALSHVFGIEMGVEELEKIGWEELKRWQKRLKEIAGTDWENVMKTLKEDRPSSEEELMRDYARLTDDYRRAVKEMNLAFLPPGEGIFVREMPEFYREIAPFAAYECHDLLGSRPKGTFFVTPCVKGVEPEEHFKEHNRAFQKLTTAHECYPGHHVHLINVACCAPRTRRLLTYAGYGLVEGWGLYAEELAVSKFKMDPSAQFEMARGCLWRAVRVIVDARLHTGKMSFEEAVNFTAKTLKMSEDAALREVWFHLIFPGYKVCYTVGKLKILDLKRWAKKNWRKYSERAFHDLILGSGDVTLDQLEELVRRSQT